MEKKTYPIHKLDGNITAILQTIISADIPGCINKGLSNEIHFIEEGTSITNPAKIVPDILNGGYYVQLSVAYCQYLWLICDMALKSIDFETISYECGKRGLDLKGYKAFLEEFISLPKEMALEKLQKSGYNINPTQYYDYLKRSLSIIDTERLKKELEMDYCLLLPLADKSKAIDIEKYYQINFDGAYEEKVNAMYCFGITFVLLHELSHFSLGHISVCESNKKKEMEEEMEADIAAFWNIYSSLTGPELFSANCGLLCVLFSFIFIFLNPNLSIDEKDNHPREDKRLFEIYDNIKDDNEKFTLLIIHMFKLWKDFNGIQDFPELKNGNLEDAINSIKEFLSGYNPN